jgi:hypothetical protein
MSFIDREFYNNSDRVVNGIKRFYINSQIEQIQIERTKMILRLVDGDMLSQIVHIKNTRKYPAASGAKLLASDVGYSYLHLNLQGTQASHF